MATIREVAALAGVSRSTVSLVINNSPLVKAETREKVLDVIKELNYVPNNNARSLSNKVMNALGIIILSEHESSNSYDFQYETGLYSLDVQRGISARLANTDYSVIIEHYNVRETNKELPKLIRNRRVDGAFVVGGFYDRDFYEKMKATGIPFVVIGKEQADTDCVWVDSGEGAALGLKYLWESGHRKLAYINCPTSFDSNALRTRGIERFVQETGADFNWDWMKNAERNSGEGGYLAMKELWEAGARPDGIVGANAPITTGAMRYLYEQGLRIPDQVSVVAYEDNILCGYAVPALTTVNIRKEYMGEQAAEMMLERLARPRRPREALKVQPYLVERNSVCRRQEAER